MTSKHNLKAGPAPVNISKIEASDTVQSHLSTRTSSKRLRVHPSPVPEEFTKESTLEIHLPGTQGPETYAWIQTIWMYAQASSLADSTYIPMTVHPTRQDRAWISSITIYALIVYCILSCSVASVHLYMNIFSPVSLTDPLVASGYDAHTRVFSNSSGVGSLLGGPGDTSQYLTRSLLETSTFEPFVLQSTEIRTNVTICAWLPDFKLYLLDEWIKSWQGSVSLLITTRSATDSASYSRLLASVRMLQSSSLTSGVALHILQLKGDSMRSPNLFLNLARLVAVTDWTLVVPGELDTPMPFEMDKILSSTKSKADIGDYVLAPGVASYPFPDLSPLLLRKDRDFWCTERMFTGVSRSSDWNECLWQLNAETTGGINNLDITMRPTPTETENRISVSERVLQQRMSARYHADICDSLIKQISVVRSRGRGRGGKLAWLKGFCGKTGDRKRGV